MRLALALVFMLVAVVPIVGTLVGLSALVSAALFSFVTMFARAANVYTRVRALGMMAAVPLTWEAWIIGAGRDAQDWGGAHIAITIVIWIATIFFLVTTRLDANFKRTPPDAGTASAPAGKAISRQYGEWMLLVGLPASIVGYLWMGIFSGLPVLGLHSFLFPSAWFASRVTAAPSTSFWVLSGLLQLVYWTLLWAIWRYLSYANKQPG